MVTAMLKSDLNQAGTARPSAAAQLSSSIRPSFLIWATALFSISIVVFVLGFYREVEWLDEVGLFNPVYMFLHTGKMTYPVYGRA